MIIPGNDAERRQEAKMFLIRRLLKKGYTGIDIRNLGVFIDWMLRLPKEMEQKFWKNVKQLEEDKVEYISSLQEIGREEGMEKGEEKGIKGMVVGMLEHGIADETIIAVSKLKQQEIDKIKRSLNEMVQDS